MALLLSTSRESVAFISASHLKYRTYAPRAPIITFTHSSHPSHLESTTFFGGFTLAHSSRIIRCKSSSGSSMTPAPGAPLFAASFRSKFTSSASACRFYKNIHRLFEGAEPALVALVSPVGGPHNLRGVGRGDGGGQEQWRREKNAQVPPMVEAKHGGGRGGSGVDSSPRPAVAFIGASTRHAKNTFETPPPIFF
jgi:hypothetical protein